jgi:hypothetical protein
MENQIKLTPEELQKIQILREQAKENVDKIGRLNIQKFFLEKELGFVGEQLQSLYSETMQLNEEEKKTVDEIVGKYGEGKLDFATGLYTVN